VGLSFGTEGPAVGLLFLLAAVEKPTRPVTKKAHFDTRSFGYVKNHLTGEPGQN
jgi:hypothetical protein